MSTLTKENSIRTSYFANLGNILLPLSISGKAPDWYTGPCFKPLAPKYDFFTAYKAGEIDAAGYTDAFNAQVLAKLDPQDVFNRITRKYGESVVLLCYETPGQFCHRRLVSAWFEANLNIKVPEWEPSRPKGFGVPRL